MTDQHLRPWEPVSPREVATLFAPADFPWWIAGGHAIEHFVGRTLRPHGDIDVLLLRADHTAARALLADWDCWAAEPPGTLRPWRADETLPASVSDIWCRENRDSPWRFQLMLDEADGRDWRSRRCSDVIMPIADLGSRDASGIPYLNPEVQLFYKAKAPRDKDETDFAAALPLLSEMQRNWLRSAIVKAYGVEIGWVAMVDAVGIERSD